MDKEESYKYIKEFPAPTIELLDIVFGEKKMLYIVLPLNNEEELQNKLQILDKLDLKHEFKQSFNSLDELKREKRWDGEKYYLNVAIGKDSNIFKTFFENLSSSDVRGIGENLGYPGCCIEEFPNHFDKHDAEEISLFAYEKSKKFNVYSFYNNRFLRFHDTGALIYHFPCNYGCKYSREIAKRRFKILKDLDSEKAKSMKNNLKSVIIYKVYESGDTVESRTDVLFSTDYEYNEEENIIHINNAFEDGRNLQDGSFKKQFEKVSKIEILDDNSFKLDGEKINDKNINIIAFN